MALEDPRVFYKVTSLFNKPPYPFKDSLLLQSKPHFQTEHEQTLLQDSFICTPWGNRISWHFQGN